jgi:CBS domain containing-hemolysin-like protein
MRALANLSPYVAGIQLAITMSGIGLGWLGEQTLSHILEPVLQGIGLHFVSGVLAFLVMTFLVVVIGELIPKYLSLRSPDRMLLKVIIPLNAFLLVIRPLTIILEIAGYWILRPFGINIRRQERNAIAKEELALIVKESSSAGEFEMGHARMVTKTLLLADLQADDIMIPRVDVVSVDADTPRADLAKLLAKQSHTRVVVCEDGDLDEIVGILHLQDALRLISGSGKTARDVMRPAVFVPPNLSLERLVDMMREEKAQMLVVRDEHGGTAGILTLEDIVEEIFGELDDQVEHAQPRISTSPDGRIIMRGDVRTDELADYMRLDENPLEREAVSTIILTGLDRVPKIGDSIETPLGILRVVNMSRRRITRVALTPAAASNS